MSRLRVEGLRKEFRSPGAKESVVALDGVSVDIEDHELLVLLGPSGCGKTTFLRSMAGLEHPDAGRIEIGPRTVFDAERGLVVPTNQRDIGMVFQDYALWPHMTVEGNVAYPLKSRGFREALEGGAALDALRRVQCDNLVDRIPAELSGGQQQRVAVARAIASNPAVVLFDEPLSNLDALLRLQTREELRLLHDRVGFTSVYVTHDQEEAFSLADRVAVMDRGRIEQLGTPAEVFDRPISPDVASFLGIRNRLSLQHESGAWATSNGPVRGLSLPDVGGDQEVELLVRQTGVALHGPGSATDHGQEPSAERPWWHLGPGTIQQSLFDGLHIEYVVTLESSERIIASLPRNGRRLDAGDGVRVLVNPDQALLYVAGRLISADAISARELA